MKAKSISIEQHFNINNLTKKQLLGIEPAILLGRISDASQEGFSLPAQHFHGIEYIDQNGFTLVAEYSITETASKHGLRKNFDKMIKDIIKIASLSSSPVNLIVEKPDRLSRNFTSKEKLQELAKSGKLRIHYYRDKRIFDENSTPADIFNDDIQTAVSKYAALNIGRETEKGMKEKARSGVFPGKVPLGYKNIRSKEETKNKRGKASIIIDPDQRCVTAAIKIFELRATGLSYESIRDQIIEEKILPPEKMKSFGKTSVEKILKNTFYDGTYLWNEEVCQGTHEIIIPQEYLDIVFNREKGKHSVRPLGPLSGLLTCAQCDCAIIYDPKTKHIKGTGEIKKYFYYHCTDGKRQHHYADEQQINISESMLLDEYEKIVSQFSISENTAKEISDYCKKEHDKFAFQQKSEIKRYQQQISALELQEDNLLKRYLENKIDDVAYQRGVNNFREERKNLTVLINGVQDHILDGFLLKSEKILELAKSAELIWKTKSIEERAQFIKTVLSNQKLNKKTVEFTLYKPFVALGKIRYYGELKKNLEEDNDVKLKWCPRRDLPRPI